MRTWCVISLSLLLAAASVRSENESNSTSTPSKRAELLWTDTCTPHQQGLENVFIASLLAAVVPKIAESGVTLLTSTLKHRAAQFQIAHASSTSESWAHAAFSGGTLGNAGAAAKTVSLDLRLDRQCLFAYSGRGAALSNAAADFYPQVIRQAGHEPALFLQASMDYRIVGKKGIVFRIIAEKLALTAQSSRGRGVKDIVITVRFVIPDVVVPGGYSVETLLPPIERVKVGSKLQLEGISSGWVSFPTLTGEAGDEFDIPATAFVRVLETDAGQGMRIYSELTDIFEKSRADLANALSDETLRRLRADNASAHTKSQ